MPEENIGRSAECLSPPSGDAPSPPPLPWLIGMAARRRWPANAATLFPELAPPAGVPAEPVRAVLLSSRPRHWPFSHRPLAVLAQAELAAPPFFAAAPWVSGRLVALWREGTAQPGWLAEALAAPAAAGERGARLLARLAEARVGGSFWAAVPALPRRGGRILGCLPPEPAAAAALIAALRSRHALAELLLLAPAGAVGRLAQRTSCPVVTAPCDPWPLLDHVEAVHIAADTPLALLALAAGRRLVCHAPLAWAGWGVSEDAPGLPRRGSRSPGELAAAALLGAARHADPFRQRRCSPEEAIDLLEEWRRLAELRRSIGSVTNIALWKRREVMAMLNGGDGPPPHCRHPTAAVRAARRHGGAVLAWPAGMPTTLPAQAGAAGVALWQIEDGFVRSVGLGADAMPPHSVVLDRRGIYFDPGRPSDLEHLLQHAAFSPELLVRAGRLAETLIRRRISKYNTGQGLPALTAPPGRAVVLVPGQVTDDRSVLLGGAGIRDNLSLLQQVRAACPEAYIVYKPHPDVDAGQRAGTLRDAEVLRLADAIVRHAAMPMLLEQVTAVHTLTSLTGFEALLRGRQVVVYGQPFYAGWGLTEDRAPLSRRTRRLTLEQLVAGTLLLYPIYLDPLSGLPCPAEVLLERLDDPRLWRPGLAVLLRRAWGRLRAACGGIA